MTLKIYQTVDHSRRNTRYAYVCASSKKQVAEILDTTVNQLNKYGCNPVTESHPNYSKYKHLKDGEVAYENPNKKSANQGISDRDLHRIAAIGYLDSAILALNNCQLPDREMHDRLMELQGGLKELKSDAKEALEHKYGGR
ncbi:hypothetical protein EWS92_21475 [Vibrio vulnificus]|uniref:hypothetical protein n=1 Tax=Vibrio vulnificus TaxID=672 RepID=UPI000BA056B0|nr:hypothetical protein [Vibrio vulnificus]EGR0790983.1 hypothetical protein [Vibrio vulnificus]EGR0799563.1 hypothetical protein [Vibrio vulnificus]EGR0817043.1 hypothetical protein [Vibrio vulnificus]EGR0828809.1 hypothetical protein [Vibrio vulnificus]EGR0849310.1 hypothetical protein [Vibrio vulnificus]